MSSPVVASPPAVRGQFAVYIAGFPVGYFTQVKIPSRKVKVTKVFPAGSPVELKFPSGLAEVEDAEVKGFQGTDGALDRAVEQWMQQCAGINRAGRTTAVPLAAKRIVTVQQLDTTGAPLFEHKLHGAFLIDDGGTELEGGDEKPVMRDMKLSVDWVERTR